MDGIYIVPSEEKPKEQGPPDAWLMGGAFNSMNNLPRDATVNNTQDAEADAIGANGALLDPENFLTGEIHFPDLADLSPRGVGPQEDNGKPSGSGHDNIPPDMISIGKPPFEGSQMQVDTSTGNSFADTNVPTSEEGAGAGRTPISNLGSNPLDSMNIPFDAALHGGIGTASLSSQGVKMDSIVHPSNAPLSAKNDAELQGFPAAETEVEMPSTKRRKTTTRRGSGGPGKTKSKSAKAASSSADGESGKAKGSSSKRSATPRGRSRALGANLTADERRKIRAERNRESAEKSRLRHKQKTMELEQNVLTLRTENRELKARVDTFRIQLQAASQNIDNSAGNGNFGGDGIVATQVPALQSAIAAIEQVMVECPRTFRPESNPPEIALNIKKR